MTGTLEYIGSTTHLQVFRLPMTGGDGKSYTQYLGYRRHEGPPIIESQACVDSNKKILIISDFTFSDTTLNGAIRHLYTEFEKLIIEDLRPVVD